MEQDIITAKLAEESGWTNEEMAALIGLAVILSNDNE